MTAVVGEFIGHTRSSRRQVRPEGFARLDIVKAVYRETWFVMAVLRLIYYLGDDPRTRSIVIYMESIGDARAFLALLFVACSAAPVATPSPTLSPTGATA